jgi:hypothetical protein
MLKRQSLTSCGPFSTFLAKASRSWPVVSVNLARLDEGEPCKIHDKKWELWRVQFLGSKKMAMTYSYRANTRLRTLGSTFSFACDAAPLEKNLVDGPAIRGANVLTKCSKKSRAKHELVSSKNQVLMHGGQRK